MKDMHKRPLFSLMLIFFPIAATVFAQEAGKETLINMQTIPMDKVETLTITSRAELLILLESENDSVVVKEYRDASRKQNKKEAVDTRPVTSIVNSDVNSGFEVTIESTTRLMPSRTDGRIEVYIPASYRGIFRLTADGGTIRSETNLDSGWQVDITITNGDLELKRVSAERINISVSSGSFLVEKLAGAEINVRHTSGRIEIGEALGILSIEALSGPIAIQELTGGGSIVTQAGTIDVGLRDVMDDFSCTLTTGNITIATPPDLSYKLNAEAQSGMVTVTPPDGGPPISALSSSIRRTFGDEADITIAAKVLTGSVTVSPSMEE
ncbi:MAG: DUF4097 domain-containing protein [Treponema sp.]|nr:DUF4097 domain-containing protein [Treponema sp.]